MAEKKEVQKESIHQTLVRIQRDLKAPKGQYNKFSNFYYRSCEDILEAVKPLLNGCTLTISDQVEQKQVQAAAKVGDVVRSSDRFYIKATARISNGTESIEVSAFAREALDKKGMDAAQITGAASSYARKYALNGLFAIDDNKDADAKEGNKTESKKPSIDKHVSVDEQVEDQLKMIKAQKSKIQLEKWRLKILDSKAYTAAQKKQLITCIDETRKDI